MKSINKYIAGLIVAMIVGVVALPPAAVFASDWSGVDKNVVEKVAREAGRPPRAPLINTDRGDLLLFVFLLAGTVGGFVAGYYFRALFPPKSSPKE